MIRFWNEENGGKKQSFLLQCSHRIWLTVPQYWSFKTNVEMNKEQSNSWEQKNQEGNRSKTPPPLPLNQHQLNDIRRVLPSFVAYRLPSFGLKKKRSKQEKVEEEKDEEKEKQGEKGNSNVCVCERERDRFAASAIAGRVSLFFLAASGEPTADGTDVIGRPLSRRLPRLSVMDSWLFIFLPFLLKKKYI